MTQEDILRMADKAGLEVCRGDGWPDTRLIPKLMRFAALVAAAERDRFQVGYERLAFLHTETMAELTRAKRDLDCISRNWWALLKHRIKTVLGIKERYDCGDEQ